MAIEALNDAVAEIIDVLQTISGIRRVPNEPPENNEQFPFAVGYPISGSYEHIRRETMKGLHNIIIELHIARKDLSRDYAQVMALIDNIPYEIAKYQRDTRFTAFETYGIISFVFKPMSWAGVDTLGVEYTINDVKIETTID